jgi:predicted nicotinamide N-methyase
MAFDAKDVVFSTPTEVSPTEFAELLDQLRSDDFSLTDCHEELMDAARYAEIDVVRAILSVYPAAISYQRPNDGNTALHMAAANGHFEIVELLLLAASRQHNDQNSSSSSSSSTQWHLIPNAAGNTALHWAASNGQIKVFKRLLQQPGVDVLLKNSAGRSILTEGFSSNSEEVIAAVLEHETATEERLVDTTSGTCHSSSNDDSSVGSVTHKFRFGGQLVTARELAIPSSDGDSNKTKNFSIIGQTTSTDDLTGYAIWASSIVMADWLGRLGGAEFRSCTVLELGAGCGVPSLVVASFRTANMVYCTDWNQTVVDNLIYNIELNVKSEVPSFSPLSAHSMNWQVPSSWPVSKVDILLGSDLIYQDDMVDTLLSTVTALRPRRFLYVAGTQRQGHDRFIEALKEHYICTEKPAPTVTNPLVDQDEDFFFIQFNELQSMQFILYDFIQKGCEQ